MFSPTESEYEAFPPAVKRKCFSTLERLRLAQGTVQSTARAHSPSSKPSSNKKPRKTQSRPNLRHHTSYLSTASTRRSKKSLTPADISQEDAQWFLRLPEKVRRGHFTAEEQILLAGGGCHDVILDAADEVVYKLGGRHANRSVPSLKSSTSSQPSIVSSCFEDPIDSAVDMDNSMMESFRWLEDDDLDLTLDDYHQHVIETATHCSSTPPSSRRPSSRRTMSLGSLSVTRDARPSAESEALYPVTKLQFSETFPQYPPLQGMRRRSSASKPASRQSAGEPLAPPDHGSSTKHYQDPEARLKLRVYLASPQKFDEAIEFGFPSLETYPKPSSRRPSIARNQTWAANAQTFFDDDDSSPLSRDHDNEDAVCPFDTRTPHKPLDTQFRSIPRLPQLKAPSIEMARPPLWHAQTEPYAHGWAGDREMTLRMTLTRPDLRADESTLYPKGNDPLALDELPPMPEEGGGDIWVKRGKDGGIFGRLWRRVSRKT